ncbi:Ubiquitin domain-containing protein 7SL RNA2 [Cardamine amara subsp. amara]|uniref:Ubiquitin domain-containing protein 7SL RNA2 n=1 Tax=Cardamine amara subsp. amara TaxID=228776 RepID=A0ABD1ARE0_CARAN
MKVFVDNRAGENMCLIEVDNSDTVLAIKEKIKRCLRVHVSNQFLYFNDKFLFHNNVHAAHLKIGPNSHLQLYVPPNRNHPIHKLHQTNQSPAPSNSTQQIIQWTEKMPSFRNNTQVLQTEQSPVSLRPKTTQKTSHVQDSPVMVRTNQEQPLTTEDAKVFETVQSPETSDYFKELNIPDLSAVMNMPSFRPETTQKISHVQDSPVMVRSNNNQEQPPWPTKEIITRVRRNNNESLSLSENEESLGIQDYFPTVKSPEASDYFKELNIPDLSSVMNMPSLRPEITQNISHAQDSPEQPWPTEEIRWVQSLWSTRTNEIVNGQDSSVMVRRNNNESRSLSDNEVLRGSQDYFPSVTVGNQVFQTVESQEESDFFNEIINIPYSPAKKKIKTSPRKLTLMVKPSEESRKIPVEVNESDNIKELKKELFRMQERGELNLPQEGFFLMHDLTILDEDVSFKKNRLTQGDTIEIFGEYFTSDDDS